MMPLKLNWHFFWMLFYSDLLKEYLFLGSVFGLPKIGQKATLGGPWRGQVPFWGDFGCKLSLKIKSKSDGILTLVKL